MFSFISGLYSISLSYKSSLTTISHCLDYGSFLISLRIRLGKFSNLIFFFKIVLAGLGPLHFHTNVSFFLSISSKKTAEILIRVALNL